MGQGHAAILACFYLCPASEPAPDSMMTVYPHEAVIRSTVCGSAATLLCALPLSLGIPTVRPVGAARRMETASSRMQTLGDLRCRGVPCGPRGDLALIPGRQRARHCTPESAVVLKNPWARSTEPRNTKIVAIVNRSPPCRIFGPTPIAPRVIAPRAPRPRILVKKKLPQAMKRG